MYHNILLPIVFDEGHDTQASFLVARALAAEDAVFTVLHVVEAIPAYAVTQLPPEVLAQTRAEIEENLASAARALPGARTALISGHSGRTIVDFARENHSDCVIIASHKPGIENYLLGSTADRVVRHAPCSVHVIR